MNARVFALVTITTLTLACESSPTAPGDAPITFETVVRSSSSGFFTPRREVIDNTEDWDRAWNLLHAGQSPIPPRPSIDFARETVALAAMGTGNNGCFQVDITAIHLRGARLEIEVTEVEPAASCSCTEVITHPVHAVRLDRIGMPGSFNVRRRTLAC